MTKEEKVIWFAGIIDGEGSICGFLSSRTKEERKWIPSPCIQLSITNANVDIIKNCQDVIENISGWRPRAITDSWHINRNSKKIVMKLSVRAIGRIEKILLAVHPFLVAKKTQAKLALDFCKMWGKKKCRDDRMIIVESLKALNHAPTSNFDFERKCFSVETKRWTPVIMQGKL